ncbi:MAG: ATP-binding protein [Halobacteriota archaeon]
MTFIGRAKGPGHRAGEFAFVANRLDDAQLGEFVCYGAERTLLARILERGDYETFPNNFLNSPSHSPHEIAEVFGAESTSNVASYTIIAKVLGEFNAENRTFKGTRRLPQVGDPIYLANSTLLNDVLRPGKETGIIEIGTLATRDEGVGVSLDLNEIASRHLAVLASTGSGKSYTIGVILEELVGAQNRGSAVLFDIHGEYKDMPLTASFEDHFTVVRPFIKIRDLTVQDYSNIFGPDFSGKMKERLYPILKELKKQAENFDFSDVLGKLGNDTNDATDAAIKWRLRSLKLKSLFSRDQDTPLTLICKPGHVSIIDLTDLDEAEARIAVGYLSWKVLRARQNYKNGKASLDTLEFPVILVIEEAHQFAPSKEDIPSGRQLKHIAREGRKFGVGLIIATQRPSRLDEDVLSQCNSSIIMKINNSSDQDSIRRGVESVSDDLISDLPSLEVGQAVICGVCTNTPALVSIKSRKTAHAGTTPDFAGECRKRYEDHAKKVEYHSRPYQPTERNEL